MNRKMVDSANAVSCSSARRIGATAAMADAPQMAVPTPTSAANVAGTRNRRPSPQAARKASSNDRGPRLHAARGAATAGLVATGGTSTTTPPPVADAPPSISNVRLSRSSAAIL